MVLIVLVSLAAPTMIAYVEHAASYEGVCGPHAPDIPGRPCSRGEYMAEFGAGFAGVGLFLLTITTAPITASIGVLTYVLLGRRREHAAPGRASTRRAARTIRRPS